MTRRGDRGGLITTEPLQHQIHAPSNTNAPDPNPPNNPSQLTREATSSSSSRGKERNNGEGESMDPDLTQPPLTSKGRRRTREDDEPLDESLSST
ncbi:hypothetical protein ACOSP7_013757 [Xanthoceras sorbifolium]